MDVKKADPFHKVPKWLFDGDRVHYCSSLLKEEEAHGLRGYIQSDNLRQGF